MAFYVERLLSLEGRSEFYICDTDWGLPEEPGTRVSKNFPTGEAAELFVRDRRRGEPGTPRIPRWSSSMAQNSPTFVSLAATSALAISSSPRTTVEESRRDAKRGAILMACLLALGIGYVVYALWRTYQVPTSF